MPAASTLPLDAYPTLVRADAEATALDAFAAAHPDRVAPAAANRLEWRREGGDRMGRVDNIAKSMAEAHALSTVEIPPMQDRVSAEEWKIRVDLAAAYRLVAHYGWDDLIFTHLSARVPGPEHHFLLNPYQLMFEEVTASSLVKVDMSGNPVEPTPFITNAAGFTIHSALHMAREDAHAVIHLHTPARPGGLRPCRGPAAADPDRDGDPRRDRLSRL